MNHSLRATLIRKIKHSTIHKQLAEEDKLRHALLRQLNLRMKHHKSLQGVEAMR